MDYIALHADYLDVVVSAILANMGIELSDSSDSAAPDHTGYDPEEGGSIDLTSAVTSQFRDFARLSMMMELACHLRSFDSMLPLSRAGPLAQDLARDMEAILVRDYGITEIQSIVLSLPDRITKGCRWDTDDNDWDADSVLQCPADRIGTGEEKFLDHTRIIYEMLILTFQYNGVPIPEEWSFRPAKALVRPIMRMLFLLGAATSMLSQVFYLEEAPSSSGDSLLRSLLGAPYNNFRATGPLLDPDSKDFITNMAGIRKKLREYGIETIDDVKKAVTLTLAPV